MFLHTALQSKAEWLVSGDKDLLWLPSAEWGFEILLPAQALEKMASK
jgi:predicted nucleic acid-binding protein